MELLTLLLMLVSFAELGDLQVVGKDLLFNENASQKLKDMVECVIRELADHAHEAFGIIAEVAEGMCLSKKVYLYSVQYAHATLHNM